VADRKTVWGYRAATGRKARQPVARCSARGRGWDKRRVDAPKRTPARAAALRLFVAEDVRACFMGASQTYSREKCKRDECVRSLMAA